MALKRKDLERTFKEYFGAERTLGESVVDGRQQVLASKNDL
jgi:hypothetical protein